MTRNQPSVLRWSAPIVGIGIVLFGCGGNPGDDEEPYDSASLAAVPSAGWFPFTGGPWRQNLTSAPIDKQSDSLISAIASNGGKGYPNLVGTDTNKDSFGESVYWGSNADPVFKFTSGSTCTSKPEFAEVHIPKNAYIPVNSDAFFTIYNVDRNLVFHITSSKAIYSGNTLTGFSAYNCDAVWHLNPTNGLDRRVAGSNCTKTAFPASGCYGHRGFATPAYPIRYDEVTDPSVLAIQHPIKITLTHTGCALGLPGHVYPLAGDEGCNGGPPEGTRLKLKSSVDCNALYSDQAHRKICVAFQQYGLVVGDQGGNNVKMENCAAERAHGYSTCNWTGILSASSFSALTWSHWQVVSLGWTGP